MTAKFPGFPARAFLAATCAALTAFLSACNGDNDSAPAPTPPGPNPSVALSDYAALPGLVLEITGVTGGSGSGGVFRAGDFPVVRFTAKTTAGDNLNVTSLESGAIYVSGPTTNYQRVIAEQTDLRSAAVYEGSGVWRYKFSAAIPATYLAPVNDTASFGTTDGELAGQALLAGTYTVGMELQQTYTAKSESFVDAGTATKDFVFGSGSVEARQVVNNDNCNVCHVQLRAHGGTRKDTRLCVLCHTAGAEDSNINNATPGVTIDFKVMIHRIHNAAHLPSVLGVSTDTNGNRVYPGQAGAVAPMDLEYADANGDVAPFSDINFPVFPNFNIAMPKDLGYSTLSTTDPDGSGPLLSPRSANDIIRRGVTACAKCHGDPDGSGARVAPTQGDRHKTAPSRRACASCHDDVNWSRPYVNNGAQMDANQTDDTCTQCHTATDIAANHLHPLNDTTVDAGVVCNVTAVTGGTAGGGKFQAGDPVLATFTLKNDAGTDIGVASMDSASGLFLGPTTNRQLVQPPSSTNTVAYNPFDFTGRLHAVSTTNKGTMSKVFQGATAVAETLVVEFTSATAFTVTGTTSGSLGSGTLPASPGTQASGSSIANFDIAPSITTGTVQITFSDATHFAVSGAVTGSGTLPAATSASTRFVSSNLSFNITVGTTQFVNGNTFQIGLFKGSVANPVAFAIVAGRTAFSATAGARDRFYYEVVPDATSYTINLAQDFVFEFLADSTNSASQVLPAAGNLPVYYGRQQLNEATLAATTTTTTEAVDILGRQVGVSGVTGFATSDMVVVEPSAGLGTREYVQITPVKADGTTAGASDTTVRIFFRTPLRYAHSLGATVRKVTLALKQEGASNAYTINSTTGVITSTGAFTASTALVLSYRSHARFGFRRHSGDTLQAYYTSPPNERAGIGEEQGNWSGLPYQSGTYTVDLWLYKNLDLLANNEVQTYRSTSVASVKDFLFGSADTIEPHEIISNAANCNTCHDDVSFHGGGRRGAEACHTCHSLSGATNNIINLTSAPSVPIEFRQMLHKIHKGRDLSDRTYPFANDSEFPAMPGGVRNCVRCHGNDVWQQPGTRSNTSASVPVKTFGVVCGACHDNAEAQAHIAANTASTGFESCAVCHGVGRQYSVQDVHRPR